LPEEIIAEGFGDQKDAKDVESEECSGFKGDTRVGYYGVVRRRSTSM